MARRRLTAFALRPTPLALAVALLTLTGCGAGNQSASPATTASSTTAGAQASGIAQLGAESGAARLSAAQALPAPGPFTVQLNSTGETDLTAWPDACQLLTADQVKAIVPGAYVPAAKRSFSTLAPPSGTGKLARHNQCDWLLGGASDGSRLTVALDNEEPPAVGASVFADEEKQARQQGEAVYDGLPAGTRCFFDGLGLSCAHADWLFTVTANLVRADDSHDSFSVDLQQRWLVPVASIVGPVLRG